MDSKITYQSPYVFTTQGVDQSDPSKIVIPDFRRLLEEHSAWSRSLKGEIVYGGESSDSEAITEGEMEVTTDDEGQFGDDEDEEEDGNVSEEDETMELFHETDESDDEEVSTDDDAEMTIEEMIVREERPGHKAMMMAFMDFYRQGRL
uniref:Anaphase-promoting complex subunit 15 n=1 Tax=Caenorhabditis tropicalis TaxID=1561998 RepID=A0A1I7V3A3_9PELO